MHRMFPQALTACIREGRAPQLDELTCVADKMRREAFATGQDDDHGRATAFAHAALFGTLRAA